MDDTDKLASMAKDLLIDRKEMFMKFDTNNNTFYLSYRTQNKRKGKAFIKRFFNYLTTFMDNDDTVSRLHNFDLDGGFVYLLMINLKYSTGVHSIKKQYRFYYKTVYGVDLEKI